MFIRVRQTKTNTLFKVHSSKIRPRSIEESSDNHFPRRVRGGLRGVIADGWRLTWFPRPSRKESDFLESMASLFIIPHHCPHHYSQIADRKKIVVLQATNLQFTRKPGKFLPHVGTQFWLEHQMVRAFPFGTLQKTGLWFEANLFFQSFKSVTLIPM